VGLWLAARHFDARRALGHVSTIPPPPILFHNCSFIVLLMDLHEESHTLSTDEYRLRKRDAGRGSHT
jgi:hypothetical protein